MPVKRIHKKLKLKTYKHFLSQMAKSLFLYFERILRE